MVSETVVEAAMGERLIIYWDVLWLINFVMDVILLAVCGTVLRLPIHPLRLAGAAAFGAALPLGFLWISAGPLMAWVVKTALGWLMVRAAFPLKGWRQTFQAWLIFYLGAWLAGGIIYSLAPPGEPTGAAPFWILLLLAGGMTAVTLSLWRRARQQGAWQVELTVSLPGGVARIPALVDSGNRLVDPLSRSPVIVVEEESVIPLLPEGWQEGAVGADSGLCPRYIPFVSVGKADGMLLGIRPLSVEARRDDGRIIACSGAIIGLTRQQLDPAGRYRALVPAAWDW
ncbi:sigma-E processing peptidase SpoIIGA [Heliomicrobium undosum]|nr:sigma-E processing peptidase SpoIIGA [Heliomicrobium undosum]